MSTHETCISATRGLCNECGALCSAKVVHRQGRVFLSKWCDLHGKTEALISSDLDWYLRSQSFVKPGTSPRVRAVESYQGCPDSCGLCPQHAQHTCVPIVEITNRCSLACPICIVGERVPKELSVEQLGGIIDRLIECEGKINLLTLSGGEPTLHPHFLEMVKAAKRPEIGMLSVSTDGLALSEDDGLLETLRDLGVVISLQMDGFRPETSRLLRGRADLGERKRRLLEKIVAVGARASLTVTLAPGVNEDELSELLGWLFGHDEIVSMMVQPLAQTDRARRRQGGDPLRAVTIPDAIRLLVAGSHGVLRTDDFSPLPCSHPACFALTYLLRTVDGSLVPLPRVIDAKAYLDIIKNQAVFNTDAESLELIRDSLYALWSSDGLMPQRDSVLNTVKVLLSDLARLGLNAPHSEALALGTKHVKSIFIHHFMDRYTFDLSRLAKCCNHYPQTDGKLLPACARNNLARYS